MSSFYDALSDSVDIDDMADNIIIFQALFNTYEIDETFDLIWKIIENANREFFFEKIKSYRSEIYITLAGLPIAITNNKLGLRIGQTTTFMSPNCMLDFDINFDEIICLDGKIGTKDFSINRIYICDRLTKTRRSIALSHSDNLLKVIYLAFSHTIAIDGKLTVARSLFLH